MIRTLERLKRESAASLEVLFERLGALEGETPESHLQGHRLCTDGARDTRIRMMLRRAKSEIVLLCDDEGFLARYAGDIARAAKRVRVYLVVGRKELAESAPIRCYTGGSDIDSLLLCRDAGEEMEPSLKVLLIADRRESLSVLEDNGRVTGIFTCPDICAGYLSRKIVQEIEPVERPRRGA